MKYQSVNLKGNSKYKFIKYSAKYEKQLNQNNNFNSFLVRAVKECPYIYSEESEHQAYMIFDGSMLIGLIYIGTSCDEQNLEIELELSEDKCSKDSIPNIVDDIIDSLGYFFYAKKAIQINLLNGYQLDPNKYCKERISENTTFYIINNKYYPYMLNLLNEMASLESALKDKSEVYTVMCEQDGYIIDKKMYLDYRSGNISLNHLFTCLNKVIFNVDRQRYTKKASFINNGTIVYKKESKERYAYFTDVVEYGINSKEFSVISINNKAKIGFLETECNRDISVNGDTLHYDKENNTKLYKFNRILNYNAKLTGELKLDSNERLISCYIDIYCFKDSTMKINGIYMLRIDNNRNMILLTSRKGNKKVIDKAFDKQIIMGESISLNMLEDIIKRMLKSINMDANISLNELFTMENSVNKALNRIAYDTDLPYLKELLIDSTKNINKQKKY